MNARLPEALTPTDAAAFLAQSHEAIISRDLDGRVIYWNRGAERLFGWAEEQVLGRKVKDFLIRDGAAYDIAHASLLKDGWWQGDLIKYCADGTPRDIECRWSLIRDAAGVPYRIHATDADVTVLRAAQHKLKLADLLFNEAAEGFVIADADGAILNANPAFAALSGYSPQALEGLPIDGLFLDEQGAPLYTLMSADLRHLGRWYGTAQLRRSDAGALGVWVSVIASVSIEGGQQLYTVMDISEKALLRQQIEYLSLHDRATGLPNRMMCEERIKPMLAIARRSEAHVLVCALRIAGLERIAQLHGVSARDVAIASIARAIEVALREGDTIGHLAEDMFMLVAELPAINALPATLERWRTLAVAAVGAAEHATLLSVQMGAANTPGDGQEVHDLFRNAIVALDRAAAEGMPWAVYSPRMAEDIGRRAAMIAALKRAMESDALELRFQPLVSLDNARLVGAEALLRWSDARLGPVSPAEFVAVAEQHGLGRNLDLWVVRAVCEQLGRWRTEGLAMPGRIAVNLSASRVADPTFAADVAAILRRTGVRPAELEVEITETSALGDLDKSHASLTRLKQAGFALAVDDFGTGYSSMAYLLRLPLDKVKIDIAFVRDMHRDPKALAIVRATLAMAQSIGLRSLAEGIEHDGQRVALAELGCELGQGYHFARPLTAAEFSAKWLH